MAAKDIEGQKQAIALRKRGHSVREIAQTLNRPKSSISLWVRDVPLNDKQVRALELRNPATRHNQLNANARAASGKARRENARALRQEAQDRGARKIEEHHEIDLFVAGCLLYWAEGSKKRNGLSFCNSDPHMMRLFVRFLTESCGVAPERLAIRVNAKTDVATASQIERYWLVTLGLPSSCLRKGTFDHPREVSGKRNRQLVHGVCSVSLGDTALLQEIYGAIQSLGGFSDPRLLD